MNDTLAMEDPDESDLDESSMKALQYISDKIADEIASRAPDKVYPYATDPDMELRCFVFEHISDADISSHDGVIKIANLEAVYQWIKGGITDPPKQEKKPKLVKPVES